MVKTEPIIHEQIPLKSLELNRKIKKYHNSAKRPHVESVTSPQSTPVYTPSAYKQGSSRLSSNRRDLSNRVYASHEARTNAIKRAEELMSNLKKGVPSFVKPMLQSHVTGGFWLGLPTHFCKSNLPKTDKTITLVNENGDEFPTTYLVNKSGLSAGWRGFSIAHKIVHGDALVFELIEPTKFKVYIVRAYSLGTVDGFTPNSCPIRDVQSKHINTKDEAATKPPKTELVAILEPLKEEKSVDDSDEEAGSEVIDGIRFSEDTIEFKDVKSFENFTIIVDDLIIDSEFSKKTRTEYYHLCCSQDTFLHSNLLQGMNLKLAAGVIKAAVDIVNAIKASRLNTFREEFAEWDNSLSAFEMLGMNLGFLRARLQRLNNIALEAATETLNEKLKMHELRFSSELKSPW